VLARAPPFCAASCRPHFSQRGHLALSVDAHRAASLPVVRNPHRLEHRLLSNERFAVAKSREMKFDGARASPVRSMSRCASSGGW
jgi:hypothetical protein